MENSQSGGRRIRIERGLYQQSNGKYAVCVIVEGRPRFRTLRRAQSPKRVASAISCRRWPPQVSSPFRRG